MLTIDQSGVPSNADRDNKASIEVARGIIGSIGQVETRNRLPGQQSGAIFERICEEFLKATFLSLDHLRPGNWNITRLGSGIARYQQYQHLDELVNVTSQNALLASTLGSDYIISPDIVIGREPELDTAINRNIYLVDLASALHSGLRAGNDERAILHASISCKWTMRSDRAQNTRSEALNLIRNRKGHLPHIAVVTGEPLPSRIASLALGTGDIDCVYHFALHEMEAAVQGLGFLDAQEMLAIMIEGKRLRDIGDLQSGPSRLSSNLMAEPESPRLASVCQYAAHQEFGHRSGAWDSEL